MRNDCGALRKKAVLWYDCLINSLGGIPIEIKILTTAEELKQRQKISSIAFHYPINEPSDHAYEVRPGVDQWGALEDGKPVSTISAIDYEMNYHGNFVKMLGIGGVCTLVEHRNRGYIRELLHSIFRDRKAKGDVFSFLYPFSFEYYGKFGYSQAISRADVRFPTANLKNYRCGYDVAMYDQDEDVSAYNTVYERFAANYTGMVRRSDWKRLKDYEPTKNSKTMYLLTENGEPRAFLGSKREMEGDERVMRVLDSAWADEEALKHLLGFIGSLRSHYENCAVTLPASLPIERMFKCPYDVHRKLSSIGQVRIMDVQKALEGYLWPDRPGSVAIGVRDDFFEDNCGVFRVEYGPDGCHVDKTAAVPDLELDIRALNPLLFGSMSFDDLTYLSGKEVSVNSNREELARAFVRRPVFITEAF